MQPAPRCKVDRLQPPALSSLSSLYLLLFLSLYMSRAASLARQTRARGTEKDRGAQSRSEVPRVRGDERTGRKRRDGQMRSGLDRSPSQHPRAAASTDLRQIVFRSNCNVDLRTTVPRVSSLATLDG
ncbi:hypothetical protein PUN28_003295 [Cardiocondyla obscurior]|uniref:Uncharacterized protein n=1 Tax=Cardiocondyla obscurior TaxID=286306 RepID=A0AAW2GL25_9HYME